MNLTNDGLKITTADKLKYGDVVPGKLSKHTWNVAWVSSVFEDDILGPAVDVHLFNEELQYSRIVRFRAYDRIYTKVK